MHCDKPSPVRIASTLLQRGVLTQLCLPRTITAIKSQIKNLIWVNHLAP
jgi:hypothetical protein